VAVLLSRDMTGFASAPHSGPSGVALLSETARTIIGLDMLHEYGFRVREAPLPAVDKARNKQATSRFPAMYETTAIIKL
jgi:hypothetical protein